MFSNDLRERWGGIILCMAGVTSKQALNHRNESGQGRNRGYKCAKPHAAIAVHIVDIFAFITFLRKRRPGHFTNLTPLSVRFKGNMRTP